MGVLTLVTAEGVVSAEVDGVAGVKKERSRAKSAAVRPSSKGSGFPVSMLSTAACPEAVREE